MLKTNILAPKRLFSLQPLMFQSLGVKEVHFIVPKVPWDYDSRCFSLVEKVELIIYLGFA